MGWKADFRTGTVTGDGLLRANFKVSLLEPSERRAMRKEQDVSKFGWKDLKGRVGAGRARALKIAGLEVRRTTQRSMSVRKELTFARFIDGGKKDGRQIVIKRYQIPKPDRVTSWKTAMHPRGFLRSDIQYDYDPASDTVVVGPVKAPRLNRLHEVGGSVKLWFMRTGPLPGTTRKFNDGAILGVLRNRQSRGGSRIEIGDRPVKARRYMAKGLAKALRKIPMAFRDQIRGP